MLPMRRRARSACASHNAPLIVSSMAARCSLVRFRARTAAPLNWLRVRPNRSSPKCALHCCASAFLRTGERVFVPFAHAHSAPMQCRKVARVCACAHRSRPLHCARSERSALVYSAPLVSAHNTRSYLARAQCVRSRVLFLARSAHASIVCAICVQRNEQSAMSDVRALLRCANDRCSNPKPN